jgi:hypothetical protein
MWIPGSEVATVITAIGLVNTLFKVFRSIYRWLKKRDPLFRENHRMFKILKSYFSRHTTPSMYFVIYLIQSYKGEHAPSNMQCNADERLPEHIQVMIKTLRERQNDWHDIPGAREAEQEAAEQDHYEAAGYTTDYEPSEMSDDHDDYDGDYDDEKDNHEDVESPIESSEDESSQESLAETDSPILSGDDGDASPGSSSDDDSDSGSPTAVTSPTCSSDDESDDFDSD